MATETARQHIARVAAENGWTVTEGVVTSAYAAVQLTRGEMDIIAAYTKTGILTWADKRRSGNSVDFTGPRNRRETVIGWLTEDPQAGDLCAQCGSRKDSNRHAGYADGHAFVAAAALAEGAEADRERTQDAGTPVTVTVGEFRPAFTPPADAERARVDALPAFCMPDAPVGTSATLDERAATEQTAADILAGRDDVEFDARQTERYDVTAVELRGNHRLAGWVDQQGRLLTSLPDDDPVIVPAAVVDSYIDAIIGIPGTHHVRQDERADVALGLIEQAEAERQDAEQSSRFDDATPCARCGAPFSSNRHNYADGHPFEAPGSGTYATLDDAEAGQPRASVERLRELAQTGSTAHVDVLARDHARTVLARLDELEALVADQQRELLYQRKVRDQRGERIAALESVHQIAADALVELERERDTEHQRAEQWRELAEQAESARLEMEVARDTYWRERDDERIRGDRLAEQYTSLRNDIARALGQDTAGPIPTDEQLVRDVTDLREAGHRVVSTLIEDYPIARRDDGSTDGLALSLRASSAVRQLADAVGVTIPREDATAPHEESDEDRGQADDVEQADAGPAAGPMFAHIITSEAPDLGDPEVLIVGDRDNEPVARWKLSDPETDIRDVMREIVAAGWRSAGSQDEWTNVQAGYWIIPVEKL